MRKSTVLILVAILLAISTSHANAFGRHARRSCASTSVTVLATQEPAVGWQFTGGMRIVPLVDFTVDGNAGVIAGVNCDSFAIKLSGNPATVATLTGEQVTFVAVCSIQLRDVIIQQDSSVMQALRPLKIVLKGTLDEKGQAIFKKVDLYSALSKRLKGIRFFDYPPFFGLDNFNIKVTGVARTGSYMFRSTNCMVLQGNYPALRDIVQAASVPAVAKKPSVSAKTAVKVGDTVTVASDGAEYQVNLVTIARLSKGAQFVVTEVRDGWIGGYALTDDTKRRGWLRMDYIKSVM